MNIGSDRIEIAALTHDGDGNPLEPEQRPAQRVIVREGDGIMAGNTDHVPVGQIPTSIALAAPAGQFAVGLRRQCWACKNFDHESWLKTKAAWETGTLSQRAALNEMRGAMLATTSDTIRDRIYDPSNNDLDLELGLMVFGVCHPLTEIQHDLVAVFPDACCPEGMDMFIPRDIPTEKQASAQFDAIMRAAQGKT